jgi:hypothetical protein
MGWFLLLAGAYTFINGLLHDIFVLRQHKGPYDRNLLRLLMDGHLLMICGAMYVLSWYYILNGSNGYLLSLLASSGMIVYCLMIFPFLKSIVTLILNVAIFAVSVLSLLHLLA